MYEKIIGFIGGWEFGDILSVVSIFSGLIFSILVSAYFYNLGIRSRILINNVYSQVLYPSKLAFFKGLELSFKGNIIQDFLVSSIGIKNVGTETIESKDFAKLCPLCLKTTGMFCIGSTYDELLDDISNPNNNVHLERIDDQTILINFDYIRVGDYFTVSVMHSGSISVLGELKDGKHLGKDVPVNEYNDAKRLSKQMLFVWPGFYICLFISAYLLEISIFAAIGILVLGAAILLRVVYRFFNIHTTKRVQ